MLSQPRRPCDNQDDDHKERGRAHLLTHMPGTHNVVGASQMGRPTTEWYAERFAGSLCRALSPPPSMAQSRRSGDNKSRSSTERSTAQLAATFVRRDCRLQVRCPPGACGSGQRAGEGNASAATRATEGRRRSSPAAAKRLIAKTLWDVASAPKDNRGLPHDGPDAPFWLKGRAGE